MPSASVRARCWHACPPQQMFHGPAGTQPTVKQHTNALPFAMIRARGRQGAGNRPSHEQGQHCMIKLEYSLALETQTSTPDQLHDDQLCRCVNDAQSQSMRTHWGRLELSTGNWMWVIAITCEQSNLHHLIAVKGTVLHRPFLHLA